MSEPEAETPPDPVMRQEDRDFMDAHFAAIAGRLIEKRLFRTNWRVEANGCVFKLKADGYPKKGTPIWQEREREMAEAMKEFGDVEIV